MIRFIQIDENEKFNDQEKEILQKHINDIFRHINAFMICMVPGFIPEEQIPPVLKNDALINNPLWVCPVSMGDTKQSMAALRELIIKVFDENEYHELSIGEKYALAQISNVGIQREESVIQSFVEKRKKRDLNKWMGIYRIKSNNEREMIKKKLLENKNEEDAIDEWLMAKGMVYRNHVVKSIGFLPLVKYEYPSAVMALFSEEEWERILKMQELEKAIGRGLPDHFQ